MKQYSVKYRNVRDHGKQVRCNNPSCGKWSEPSLLKYCPSCGKWTIFRRDERRCDDCGSLVEGSKHVCRFCGCEQRSIVELRGIRPEKLTAFAHLLHEGQPSVSLAECRSQCRGITSENPYRLSFARRPERIRPFIQAWNALGGTAVACHPDETSRRPIVLLRSYNCRQDVAHVRLLYEAVQKSDRPNLSFGETAALLHGVNAAEKPVRLRFTSDFDHIDDWVAAWRRLGGTAVRSPEHA